MRIKRIEDMKKNITAICMLALGLVACQNDDTDFSAYTDGTMSTANVIYIFYNGTTATASGDENNYVTINGADVTVNTGTATDSLLLVLSGSTSDGSLLIYREKKFGIKLAGVTIHNNDGPAINNQCGKSLYMEVVSGTTNTLSDGTSYTEQVYQQKGALFSEGQIYFSGSGTLRVVGSTQHAIACDDYIVVDEATITASSATGHGIKVNDGFWMNSGTVKVDVTGNGCKGINNDSITVISGGTMAITTTGDCVYDTEEADYSSAACIKSDYQFKMTGGTVTLVSSGDGGKGINCDEDVVFSGGTLDVTTTGGNEDAKPKGVKGDMGITVSGGSFKVSVNKSWACDNGSESDSPADHLTLVGTPTTSSIAKKAVEIVF
jgi:archaellum component FlaF (FlaF/FlaG flagellin family)